MRTSNGGGMATERRPNVRRVPTAALTPDELAAIRDIMTLAFGDDEEERFNDDDWAHALGGTHVVLDIDGEIVTHASVVERELRAAGLPLKTGYVEAVATTPVRQGEGHGTLVMREVNAIISEEVELGAPRHGPSPLLRAARMGRLAGSDLRPDRRWARANAGRGRRHPRPRDT